MDQEKWIGKYVSINCGTILGIFQGQIKRLTSHSITLSKAFRNGVPLRQQDFLITIKASDIVKMHIVPNPNASSADNDNTTKQQNKSQSTKPPTNEFKSMKVGDGENNGKYFMTPTKDEIKTNPIVVESTKAISKPIDVIQPKSNLTSTPFKNDKKKKNNRFAQQNSNKNQTFSTSMDDPLLDEDFDFEKNLALFDKQAIWNELDATQQKPDLLRQTMSSDQKYRHDENILTSAPTQYRQIQIESNEYVNITEYVTDSGLLIPCVPLTIRNKIQEISEKNGLIWDRICDTLSRNATELAIQLLGGARRLTPANQHQWPQIAIICDESDIRSSELGFSTGRILASHGLKVMVFHPIGLHDLSNDSKIKQEMSLYAATGNKRTYLESEIPSADLVILSVKSTTLSPKLIRYINLNRTPVMAIDPHVNGITSVNIKCSILPILPLINLSLNLGKLYLCNVEIPDQFFFLAGINKYKSPFGHKSVIPLHNVN